MSQTTNIFDALQQFGNQCSVLSKFHLEIGVFVGKTKRKVAIGVTNA